MDPLDFNGPLPDIEYNFEELDLVSKLLKSQTKLAKFQFACVTRIRVAKLLSYFYNNRQSDKITIFDRLPFLLHNFDESSLHQLYYYIIHNQIPKKLHSCTCVSLISATGSFESNFEIRFCIAISFCEQFSGNRSRKRAGPCRSELSSKVRAPSRIKTQAPSLITIQN